jgi:hypothetical protein
LQEDELLARSVALFRESFAPQGHVDAALLAALGRVSRELTEDHVADALDLALLASDARAFASLWDRLSDSRPLPPSVAEGLVAYGRSGSKLGRSLVDRLIDGSMFRFVDAVVPDDQAGLAAQVPRWSSVLGQSLGAQGRIAGELGRLFAALGQPIPCMQGARALRYSPLDVIGELVARPTAEARSFVERDKLSELYLAYPLCSFPAEVAPGYRALMELAGTPAIEPMTDLLRSAYGVQNGTARPVAEFLVQALADPGFQKLLPALSELRARGAWDDLLLLATLPRFPDRTKIVDLLKVLVEPLPGAPSIGGQPATILDVLVQGFARVEPEELTAWLTSFHATDAGLASALRPLSSTTRIRCWGFCVTGWPPRPGIRPSSRRCSRSRRGPSSRSR